MKAAVLYLRVSTIDQVKNQSLSTQRERCEEFCRREGYEILEVFEERGESAKTANRTEFQRSMKWCQKNRKQVDAFVVYAFDRFCRSSLDHATYRARLAGMGITLHAVTQPIDTSPAGEFLETVLAAQAQLDNRLRAERTVDGMRKANTMGRWTHKAPMGYVNGRRGGPSLEADPERAALVASAFERISTGTCNLADVRRCLRKEGLRTRRGHPVAVQTFQSMVRNAVYCGRLINRKWNVEVTGDWEPLVSEELFDSVQLILDGRRPSVVRKPRQRTRPEFPLKGFVRCAKCNKPLTAESKKEGRFLYYRCWNRNCTASTFPKSKVEDAFVTLLDSLRPRPEYVRLFREVVVRARRQDHEAKGDERQRLEQRRDSLQDQKQALGRELARGILDSNSYQTLRDEVDNELLEARVALTDTTTEELDVESILDFAEELFLDPAKMWRQLPPEKKRLFQDSMFPEGVAFDGRVHRTQVTASFLGGLRDLQGVDTGMASQSIASSNSGEWITVLGVFRKKLMQAA